MPEILASVDDINTHLPTDKFTVEEATVDLLQISVARMIRGYLSNTFTKVTLVSWDSPADTPELIREVAGKLIAALYYAQRVAEDTTDDPPSLPQQLYDQAMKTLSGIRSGEITLLDSTEDPTTTGEFTTDDFFPIDDTDRAFSMGKSFS